MESPADDADAHFDVEPEDHIWLDGPVLWKDTTTWADRLTSWLAPRLKPDGLERLKGLGEQDLCWDDSDWLDVVLKPAVRGGVEGLADRLADSLFVATLRVYHGCRLPDAGVLHREGLRVNDPAKLEDEARRIVAECEDLAWMRPGLEQRIAEFSHRERDTGRVYVCIDDRVQLDRAGHYALYGPEWLQVFFSFSGFHALRSRGVPTIVELDLPLEHASDSSRTELARALLQEWTRVIVNAPDWSPDRDFTIILDFDIPAEYVVGHSHPAVLRCPYNQMQEFVTEVTACPACSAARPIGER